VATKEKKKEKEEIHLAIATYSIYSCWFYCNIWAFILCKNIRTRLKKGLSNSNAILWF